MINIKIINEKLGLFRRTYIWYSDELIDVPNSSYVKYIGYKKFADKKGFSEHKAKTLLIDLTKSENEIFKNFEKNCRNSITKAEKERIKIETNDDYESFHKIYKKYMKTFKIRAWSLDFIKQGILFTAKQKQHSEVECARVHEKIISGAIMVNDSKHSAQIIQATAEKVQGANNLLLWEMIKHAKKLGCKTFDLGGIELDSEKETGVDKFKKSFGGKEADVWHYEKTNSFLYKLLKRFK